MIAQKNKIPPSNIFSIIFISRIAMTLVNINSGVFGNIGPDLVISLIISLLLTIILTLPVLSCVKRDKSPFDNKALSTLYFLYFVFISAVNVSRFSYFASTTLNPEASPRVFTVLIIVCAAYCCRLGIEAIGRVSAVSFFLICLTVIIILSCNISEFDEINLYPVITDSNGDIMRNAVFFTANSGELAVFLCLSDKVNRNAVKQYIISLLLSFVTILALIYFMLASLGESANFQSFPIFTMLQISKISNFERPDVLHISFWILVSFMKSVISIYCAVSSLKAVSAEKRSVLTGAVTLALSVAFTREVIINDLFPEILIIPFFIFCVVIPLGVLIFKKRSSADDLLKSF